MARNAKKTMQDHNKCDGHLPVLRNVTPDAFKMFEVEAKKMGISHAACAPLVRSSYFADEKAQGAGV